MAETLGTAGKRAAERKAVVEIVTTAGMSSDQMRSKGTSFYEYAGIIIPGSCFLFGLFFVLPDIRQIFLREGFSLSGLILFLLIAYAAGHLIADIGDIIEKIWWGLQGGMPTEWPTKPTRHLITENQRQRLVVLLRSRFNLEVDRIVGLEKSDWQPILSQIYADLVASGRANRVEMLLADYRLSRSIAAATLTVAGLNMVLNLPDWDTSLGFILGGLVALYRMQRSAINYSRELILQFLQLPELRRTLVANDFGGNLTVS
jgi:hypothetical protein